MLYLLSYKPKTKTFAAIGFEPIVLEHEPNELPLLHTAHLYYRGLEPLTFELQNQRFTIKLIIQKFI